MDRESAHEVETIDPPFPWEWQVALHDALHRAPELRLPAILAL